MEVTRRLKLHNRFDIEVRDAATGELKQQAFAENIILNNLYSKLFGTDIHQYSASINVGSGAGTLGPTRTNLFTPLLNRNVDASKDVFSKSFADGYVSLRRAIVILENEYNGNTFTEVGFGIESTYYGTTGLTTHALLKDMSGAPVSILKKDTDIITVYGTIYLVFAESDKKYFILDDGKTSWDFVYPDSASVVTGVGNDVFIGMLLGREYPYRSAFGGQSGSHLLVFSTSLSDRWRRVSSYGNSPTNHFPESGGCHYITPTLSVSVAEKRWTVYARLPADKLNAVGDIRAVSYLFYYDGSLYGSDYVSPSVKRSGFTTDIVAEQLGLGDGIEQDFGMHFPFVHAGAVIKVDGVEQTTGVTVDTYKPNTADFRPILRVLKREDPNILAFPLSTDNWSGSDTFIFENIYYATAPVKDISIPRYSTLSCSDDAETWTEVQVAGANTDNAYTVDAAYRNKRYWKLAPTAGQTSYSRLATFGNSDFAGYKNVHFTTPPASGAVITADYTTDCWAKDANHVLDITFNFVFSDGSL